MAPLFDLPAAPAAGAVDVPLTETPLARADQLLRDIKDNRAGINERMLGEVKMIAEWALEHTVAVPEDASTLTERGLDTGLPLAGEGAPLISDFAVLELGAILARGIDSVRNYVGQVVELSHRLPQVWARVLDGHVPTWKGLRIADCTRDLGVEAVGFVDQHLARFATTCSWAQVERLIDEAITRFDPALAEERRKQAAETRHFDIDFDRAGTNGTVPLHGEVDLADALDAEQALRHRARELAELGCTESLDVRRAMAFGEMARCDLTLNYLAEADQDPVVEETGHGRHETPSAALAHTPRGRTVDLTVHLSQAAVEGITPAGAVGRLDNTHTPVTAEQIREWCAAAGTIIVRPVLDVAGHEPTGAYEIAERQARQVLLRDQTCIFPGCGRPAEACDLDHVIPHAKGGVTCPCNLAPVCRGHHRVKTHHGWTYWVLAPGVYYWRGRTGHQWLVTPGGTYALDTQPCPGSDPPPE
ncbi:hypothetical protein HNR19_001048 [Nocardioides thalensis]|uniref:HNH nuclease domain-containing protein n=1 Tax=Nocardioides thalensis TaxID=1914755 RepID=A0A853BWQ5_9ACTN|nr:HNH endonuclease signature motif containing protein [Nocardioides thalensis]NYJ00350.1 hypothetical protein [Nocardioides thalensis]